MSVDKEVNVDMASFHLKNIFETPLAYLHPLVAEPAKYSISNNDYNKIGEVITILENLISPFDFECMDCDFISNDGGAAAMHRRSFNLHNISGVDGWWCSCGQRIFSPSAAIMHNKSDWKNEHSVFRFGVETLKKQELMSITSDELSKIISERIDLGVNMLYFCLLNISLISLEDLIKQTQKCAACINYPRKCNPGYKFEVLS